MSTATSTGQRCPQVNGSTTSTAQRANDVNNDVYGSTTVTLLYSKNFLLPGRTQFAYFVTRTLSNGQVCLPNRLNYRKIVSNISRKNILTEKLSYPQKEEKIQSDTNSNLQMIHSKLKTFASPKLKTFDFSLIFFVRT